MRLIWLVLGVLSLLIGLIGIVVPLLPTVPLMILAAFFFAKSSPRLHDWLMAHPKFGPPIHEWREHGAIARRGKYWATVSVAAAFAISVVLGVAAKFLVIQAVTLAGVMIFIWSRPST